MFKKGKKAIYKIHGSTKNIITGENTRESLVATIQALGSSKEGENIFQVESFKQPLFEHISRGRTLVVMGYSGSDDFDIIPTLTGLIELKDIIWINHTSNDNKTEKIYEINKSADKKRTKTVKVDQILAKLYRMNNAECVYRVDVCTSRLFGSLIDTTLNFHSKSFSISPASWLIDTVRAPDEFEEYIIPFKIYNVLEIIKDAMKCSKIILKRAKRTKNNTWKAAALNNIGSLLDMKGNIDGALHYYKKALVIDKQLDDPRGKATRLNNIGSLLGAKGKREDELRYYKEALAIAKQYDYIPEKIIFLNNIGFSLDRKGNIDSALRYYKEALAFAEQQGDISRKATILNNIGFLLYRKGNLEEALKYYEEALPILEQLKFSEAEIVRNNIKNLQNKFKR
ncbi:MAG: hypothetical protein BAJALOKI1v1_1870004 [Promethearchaeota archaeon]|nr:MAG: hypothetical protein BAJALOKI1v1_1870004 [Candidatus Lokiarchaeota archaeon]